MSADADNQRLRQLARDEPEAVRSVAKRAGENKCEELEDWLLSVLEE